MPQDYATVQELVTLVGPRDLREAINRGKLEIALQPMVELRSGRPTRIEALCRWNHASGKVTPAQFIPMAEANDLITPLTLFVARTAAQHLRRWRAERPDLVVNFNLSLTTLLDPTFHEELVRAIEETHCDPAGLGVEITERTRMLEPAATARALGELRGLGIRVEIDDFGTGYSSLGRLIDLPIDALKIDRRFVSLMAHDHRSEAIVRACIALAHDLALEAVAEGVEDRETWTLLRALGCDTAQGHYSGSPMPAQNVPAWLSSWEARLGIVPAVLRDHDVAARAVSRSDGGANQVLVVDDEPAIAEIIRDVLEQEGFKVLTAANGVEALRQIDRMKPAVVMLDMQMPILDGSGFVKALRARGLNVPIIVMTAGSSAARWAEEIDAAGYLSKPFDISGLVAVASRYAVMN